MLYLHKNENDLLGQEIREYLLEVSAAHKLIEITNEESFLAENENEIKGREAIFFFLENYNKQLVINRMVSGDSCYMDPETGLTC